MFQHLRDRVRRRAVDMSSTLELRGWPVIRMYGVDAWDHADAAQTVWRLGKPSLIDLLAGRWAALAERGVPLVTIDVTTPDELLAAVDVLQQGAGVLFCSPEARVGVDTAWLRSLVGSGLVCGLHIPAMGARGGPGGPAIRAAVADHRRAFGIAALAVSTGSSRCGEEALDVLLANDVAHVFVDRPGLADPSSSRELPRIRVGRDVDSDTVGALLMQPPRVQAVEMTRLKAAAAGGRVRQRVLALRGRAGDR